MIYRLLVILLFTAFIFSPVGRNFLHKPGLIFFMTHRCRFILVLGPLVEALLRRTVHLGGIRGERQMDRIRNLQHRLWGWTVVGLAVIVLSHLWHLKSGGEAFSAFVLALYIYLFLTYTLHRPLLQAKKPAADSDVFMPATGRAASLTPRHTVSTPYKRVWLILWGIWAAVAIICMCFLAVRSSGFFDDDVFAPLFIASAPLVIGPFALRLWLRCPEPMDPAGSSKLAQAYIHLRQTKSRCIFVATLSWSALFLAMALLCASHNSNVVGYLLVPSMLGMMLVSGSITATYALERKKVAKLLRDLADESEPSPENSEKLQNRIPAKR